MPTESSIGWRPAVVFFLASASIGWGTGYLAGQSGPDANVLAAVLPVVVSGAGGALVFQHLRTAVPPEPADYYITGFAVIVFICALLAGSLTGLWVRTLSETAAYEQSLLIRYKLTQSQHEARMHYLERCSRQEFIINRGRQALGLPPLSSELICGDPPS